ncbi:MAG TPA: BTAD domain-containing putative transcriptional regulator [Roseiflexaceae bacterium]|nr:BTAD domain-containing putative transcriptional regulator [Roseiflexaceae bacterium]
MIPTLYIQLLGGFRLRFDDRPVTALDLPRQQALLAYLVLHRAAPHARPHLAFRFWPDTTDAQARSNLRTLLQRLRQALPHADQFLHIDAQTVQWRTDAPWTLDVMDFEHALALADQAEHRENPTALRRAVAEAVERYHGDLLPAWYDDWVLLERERLRQLFLTALERLMMLLEREQDYPAAISYAQRLLRHDPLHEVTYQHLMRLHGLSGDRASALRVYHTCATVLERELAVEPSPTTRDVYERLLHMEAPPAAASARPTPLSSPRLHNLPSALASFIGRARERAEITRLLAHLPSGCHLLTLTGTGGCGKTRLALEVAGDLVGEYSDGVWLVELAGLADGALLPQAVASALGVREEAQRPLTPTLVDALRSRALLLVLDTCEHLIEPCAQLAQTLLSTCPQLRILATSREALGLAGETAWLVPSLDLPEPHHLQALTELSRVEAVRLFVERAAAALPTFMLTQENAAAVAQVCRRLDGIPLAIELAAARVKVVSVETLAARLDDSVRLLTAGSRTALPRQQTLRATIDWSYDLLSEPERALFQRLAVFAGGWTLEAADAVCAGASVAVNDVLDLLAHLVDKSLVVVDRPPSGAVRYRLLEPIRQYAHMKLMEAAEAPATRQQHAHFFLALTEQAEPQLAGAEQVTWLNRLEQEHDNLRAALQWFIERGEAAPGLRLGEALWRFWRTRGHLTEGRACLAELLALPTRSISPESGADEADWPAARAKALIAAGDLAAEQDDYATAHALLEEGLTLGWKLADERHIARALGGLAILALAQGDDARAATLYEESLTLSRKAGDQHLIAGILDGLGVVALNQGDEARAVPLVEESLALYRDLGDTRGIADALRSLGWLALNRGDLARAAPLLEESLALYRQQGYPQYIAWALRSLGSVALLQGHTERAAALCVESLTLGRKVGDRYIIAWCLEDVAGVALAQGDPLQAVRLLGAAEGLRATIGAQLLTFDRARYERIVAAVRAALEAAAFAAAWAAGRALPLEQAIAEALAVADEATNRTVGAPVLKT